MRSDPAREQWHTTESGRARLSRDREILRCSQPHLVYQLQPDNELWLVGDFVLHTDSGVPHRVPVQMRFRWDYPSHEPSVHDHTNRFVHDADHHFIQDRACVWFKLDSQWRRSDPDALEAFLDQVVIFFYRQLVFENDPVGGYPGPVRPHGYVAALADIAAERLNMPVQELWRMTRALAGGLPQGAKCTCGEGSRYRDCHRRVTVDLRSRLTPEDLDALVIYVRRPLVTSGSKTRT